MTQAPAPSVAPKTSGMAIASVVCGILGFCTAGIASLIGLVLGIVALKKINASAGAISGRGLSIGGILLSVVSLLAGVALAAACLFGWLLTGRVVSHSSEIISGLQEVQSQAFEAVALSNAGQLTAAAAIYCDAHDDQYPPPATWPQALTLDNPNVYAEPARPGTRMFAMNAALKGLKQADVPNPTQTVLFFECAVGKPPGGGAADLPATPRFPQGYVIGFCDNHVDQVTKENLGNLIWNPKAVQASTTGQ